MKQVLFSYLLFAASFISSSAAEFQINTRTTYDQKNAAIAACNSGNFIVTWDSYRHPDDGDSGGIVARIFDSKCCPITAEFIVNETTAGNQKCPDVAADADGNFIIVWQGPGPDEEDIFAKIYDANGNPVKNEFRVNNYTTNRQLVPAVAMNNDGNFIIVWESMNVPQEDMRAICAQSYDSSGQTLGSQIRVNDQNDVCRYPDVALSNLGQAVVVWVKQSATYSIWSRHFPADGSQPVWLSKQISESPNFTSLTRPSICIDSTGNYIIAWDGHSQNHNEDDIHIKAYNRTHAPWHSQYIVAAGQNAQKNPSVAISNDGWLVVLWEGDCHDETIKRNIFGRRFTIDFDWPTEPNRLGDEFTLNIYIIDEQRYPTVAITASSRFVGCWQSHEQDGSGHGIFGGIGPKPAFADFTGDGFVDFRDFCILAEEWLKDQNPLKADLIDDNSIDKHDLSAFCQQWLTPRYKCCEVDIDDNGKINFKDYALLAANWLNQGPNLPGDITANGTVDITDLHALLFHWTNNCK